MASIQERGIKNSAGPFYKKENEVKSLKPMSYRNLHPLSIFFRDISPEMQEKLKKSLKYGGYFAGKSPENRSVNITPLDFFSLPIQIQDNLLLNLMATRLGLEKEDLNSPHVIKKINIALEKTKCFIEKYLLIALPNEIKKLSPIKSENDLLKILRKAKPLKYGGKVGLSPYYCAFIAIAFAEWEFQKKEFIHFQKENEYFYRNFLLRTNSDSGESSKSPKGMRYFHFITSEPDEDLDRLGVHIGENQWLNVLFHSRGKGEFSTIAKMGREPEMDTMQIMKDGIGFTFETEDLPALFNFAKFMGHYLSKEIKASEVVFENFNCIDGKEKKFLERLLKKQKIKIIKQPPNASSNPLFRVIKFTGKIEIPVGGNQDAQLMKRGFEIQINPKLYSVGDIGMAQSKIYKRMQKFALVTRLFGSFSEDYLDLICQDASMVTGISAKKIKDYALNRFLLKVKDKKQKSGPVRYAHKEHLSRWQTAKILPEDLLIQKKDN